MYDIISLLIHRLFSAQRQYTTSGKRWEDNAEINSPPSIGYMGGCTTELQLITHYSLY